MNSETNVKLEQYKLYVKMTDNVSQRRMSTNLFYISLLSIILGLPIVSNTNFFLENCFLGIALALFGIILCFLWIVNINSYRQINSGKFKVIHEIEKELPFKCYIKEWEFLGKGQNRKKYLQLSFVEQFVPYFLLIPFIILLFFGIFRL